MRNQYSISEFLKISYSYVLTKLLFPKARLIRRPIYIRGRKSMTGGVGITTGRFCRFDLSGDRGTLHIGDNCEIGDNVHIVAYDNVTIGNNVLMVSKIFISDTNHGNYKVGKEQSNPYISPNDRLLVTEPTRIGNNVWVGENVVVLPGSVVGDGCIIGANTVVTGIIPDNTIVVGCPARVIKQWNNFDKCWEKC